MAKVSLISLYDRGCLGLRYISAVLKKAGHKPSIIYMGEHSGRVKKTEDEILGEGSWEGVNCYGATHIFSYSGKIQDRDKEVLIELLEEQRPDLIGFSLRTMSLKIAIELTERIKNNLNVPVIFGGVAVTTDPQECIKYADLICLGEGEATMVELANRIDRRQPYHDVSGIWLKCNDRIYKNALCQLEQDLDSLPFPDYEAGEKFSISKSVLNRNFSTIGNLNAFTYDIITSRGCPFACSYCCNELYKKIYSKQRYLRRRSASNVIEELKEAKGRFGIQTVMFRDDVFTFDLEWIEEFAKRYKKEIGLPFWCFTHPNFADRKILEILKNTGLFSITMGIESGSENTLYNIFNRRTPIKKIYESIMILEKLRLPTRPRFDIITNNPFETDEDREKTLEFLMSLPKPVNFGLAKLNIIPGSRISKMALEQGIFGTKDAQQRNYNFWNYLYLLNQYRFFPNSLIRAMKRSSFLRKHPKFIQLFLIPKLIEYNCSKIRAWLAKRCPRKILLLFKKIRYFVKSY
jgi:radical SAM superfamily enzyme YgiQ (UPF0313 family)